MYKVGDKIIYNVKESDLYNIPGEVTAIEVGEYDVYIKLANGASGASRSQDIRRATFRTTREKQQAKGIKYV